MDMRRIANPTVPTASYQCCHDDKYIHFKRDSGNNALCAYFHFEIEDEMGGMWMLPGEMTVTPGYQWMDAVEPVVMAILDGIIHC